jgi:hypothetical protein
LSDRIPQKPEKVTYFDEAPGLPSSGGECCREIATADLIGRLDYIIWSADHLFMRLTKFTDPG